MISKAPETHSPHRQELGSFERLARAWGRIVNETRLGRQAQDLYLRGVGYTWMRAVLSRGMLVDGLNEFRPLNPDRGVLLVTNHRSFFDLYAVSVAFFAAPTPWVHRVCFPVRADFFYESALGPVVNMIAGAGVMYPPFYRQRAMARFNREALDGLVQILGRPGWLVGFHPEGTRNKSTNPYELLPLQPGAGELALKADAIVVPVFINGLSNDLLREIKRGFGEEARRDPCICVFGAPVSLEEFRQEQFGPRVYKLASEKFGSAILDLATRERELRAACAAGGIAENDARWLRNLPGSRLYARRSV